jgi:hypothetical protein
MRIFQERMFRLITRREGNAGDPPLAEWIVAKDDDDAADKLGVYAGMFAQRMVDALEQDFPRTLEKLGRERFAEVVGKYVAAHPSTDASIRNLGARFAAFVGEDSAHVDWACVEAVDAPDAEPFRRAAFERLPAAAWSSLWLALVPSARIVGRTLVWRRGFDVCERQLDDDEARAVLCMHGGCTFAGMCEAYGALPERIRAALEQWLVDELVMPYG